MNKLKPMKKPYKSLISFVADRPGHDWRYAIDSTKIKTQLGFFTSVEFETGLINTINFYLSKQLVSS